jgi:hypothetical protein
MVSDDYDYYGDGDKIGVKTTEGCSKNMNFGYNFARGLKRHLKIEISPHAVKVLYY